ncbi:MAG: M42 family peptidase, partial [Planctomycetota bacterium]
MDEAARQFFHQLVTTPGVSGFEQPVQRVVRGYAQPFAEQVETDLHGNLILAANPTAATRIMLAGHADQIGLILSHIDEDGYLYTQPVGGW